MSEYDHITLFLDSFPEDCRYCQGGQRLIPYVCWLRSALPQASRPHHT
jgi:hypothetical protein